MADRYASLKQGLVGCWIPSISGSGLLLPDLSGRGNNGALTNMDASDWVSSQYGRALDFDGVNDRVDFGSTSLVPSGSFSIVWWEQISTVGANVFFPQVTLRLSASASFLIYRSNYNVAGQDYRFLSFGQATSTLTNVLRASNASDPGTVTEIWNCFCITGTSITSLTAANFAVYENGRSLTIVTAGQYQAGTYVNNFASDGLGTFSLTKLDDIRIYNRALTESEIRLLSSEPGIGFKPAKKLSRFSQRFTYNPPKARNYGVVRVKETDYGTLRQGLVGAWCPSLPNGGSGNTLPDVSGYGNHGTLTNMSSDDWVSSQYGRALDFDGVNDYISIGTNPTIAGKSITCSGWIYGATLGDVYPLMQYNTSLGANSRAFYFGSGNWTAAGQITFIVGTTTTDYFAASGPQFVAGQWNHIGFVVFIDGASSTIKMFLNGMQVSTIDRSSGTRPSTFPTSSLVPFEIQSGISGTGLRFYGNSCQIDDIRVYNRLLSDNEIRLLASRPGIGLRQDRDRNTFYQFPSGARRKRILTGMP